MAFYDSSDTYDSARRYDETVPPLTQRPMKRVKLNLSRKRDSQLLTFSQQHITAMDGNANFPTPLPAAVDYQALHDDFEAKLDAAEMSQQECRQKFVDKDAARAALESALKQRGGYIESTSAGDEAMILSSNLPVRNTPAPIGVLPAPTGLEAFTNGFEGQVQLSWDSVRGAKSYEIQLSPDPNTPSSWSTATSRTGTKATLSGLTAGARCWFRVRALGAAGFSEWSDPAVKRVP